MRLPASIVASVTEIQMVNLHSTMVVILVLAALQVLGALGLTPVPSEGNVVNSNIVKYADDFGMIRSLMNVRCGQV
jgi:hypothetical protein